MSGELSCEIVSAGALPLMTAAQTPSSFASAEEAQPLHQVVPAAKDSVAAPQMDASVTICKQAIAKYPSFTGASRNSVLYFRDLGTGAHLSETAAQTTRQSALAEEAQFHQLATAASEHAVAPLALASATTCMQGIHQMSELCG